MWRVWREAADVGSRSFRCHPLEIGLCEKYKVEVVISNLIDEESCEGKNRGESERGKGGGECEGKRRAVWLGEKITRSLAPFPSIYLLIVCRLARISRDGSCFLELTTRFLLSAPASCCEPQGLLVSWCACPVAAKSLNNHRHANKCHTKAAKRASIFG